MPPKKKTHEVTLALEAGNAAMVDLGKMLGPTGANMRAVKVEYDEATSKNRGEIIPVVVSVYGLRIPDAGLQRGALRTLTAWTPLVEVDDETGCMGYCPGSQTSKAEYVNIFTEPGSGAST